MSRTIGYRTKCFVAYKEKDLRNTLACPVTSIGNVLPHSPQSSAKGRYCEGCTLKPAVRNEVNFLERKR